MRKQEPAVSFEPRNFCQSLKIDSGLWHTLTYKAKKETKLLGKLLKKGWECHLTITWEAHDLPKAVFILQKCLHIIVMLTSGPEKPATTGLWGNLSTLRKPMQVPEGVQVQNHNNLEAKVLTTASVGHPKQIFGWRKYTIFLGWQKSSGPPDIFFTVCRIVKSWVWHSLWLYSRKCFGRQLRKLRQMVPEHPLT